MDLWLSHLQITLGGVTLVAVDDWLEGPLQLTPQVAWTLEEGWQWRSAKPVDLGNRGTAMNWTVMREHDGPVQADEWRIAHLAMLQGLVGNAELTVVVAGFSGSITVSGSALMASQVQVYERFSRCLYAVQGGVMSGNLEPL